MKLSTEAILRGIPRESDTKVNLLQKGLSPALKGALILTMIIRWQLTLLLKNKFDEASNTDGTEKSRLRWLSCKASFMNSLSILLVQLISMMACGSFHQNLPITRLVLHFTP
mmetsp:Transcript_27925/g.42283  ORF Transcript_27925/g.42283 Transcript_27925/m.42283 type:complete len:112 (+) Transcript_27925:1629-1964(+)